MCKTYEHHQNAIDNLTTLLRGETVTDRRAIYERDGDVLDLVAFFTVLNGTEATFLEVDEHDEVHPYDFVPYYGGMGNRKVAQLAGCPTGIVRRF